MTNAISPSLLSFKTDCFIFTLGDSWCAVDAGVVEFNEKGWEMVCDTLKGG